MSFWGYYGRVIGAAVRNTFSHARQKIFLGVILSMLALIFQYFLDLRNWSDTSKVIFSLLAAAVMVIFGSFIWNLVREPVLLHRRQQATTEDQARSIQDLEKRTSEPVLSPQEEAKRQRVRKFIAGAPRAEIEVLQYILNSGDELYNGTLYDAFQSQRELVASSLQRWEHKLVQRRLEPGTMKTYWSIIAGLKEALGHVLHEPDSANSQ